MDTRKPMNRSWKQGICGICCWLGMSSAAFASRIDLAVESIQVQPPRPYSAEAVTVVAVIRNNGSEQAQAFDISVSVRQNEKKVRSIEKIPVLSTLPRMGSGKSVPVEVGLLPEGDYQVAVTIDPENNLAETDETNNSGIKSFHVSATRYA